MGSTAGELGIVGTACGERSIIAGVPLSTSGTADAVRCGFSTVDTASRARAVLFFFGISAGVRWRP